MESLKKMIDENDYTDFISECETQAVMAKKDPNLARDILKEAEQKKKVFIDGYVKENSTIERKAAFDILDLLIRKCRSMILPTFAADADLGLQASDEVDKIKKMIAKMTVNGRVQVFDAKGKPLLDQEGRKVSILEEENIRNFINGLGFRNGEKYIDSEHPEIKNLWKIYSEKFTVNYSSYSASDITKPKRIASMIVKIQYAFSKGRIDQVLFDTAMNKMLPLVTEEELNNARSGYRKED